MYYVDKIRADRSVRRSARLYAQGKIRLSYPDKIRSRLPVHVVCVSASVSAHPADQHPLLKGKGGIPMGF